MADLDWAPEYGLVDGLKDSYDKDFGRGGFRKAADFRTDDMILAKLKGRGGSSSSSTERFASVGSSSASKASFSSWR